MKLLKNEVEMVGMFYHFFTTFFFFIFSQGIGKNPTIPTPKNEYVKVTGKIIIRQSGNMGKLRRKSERHKI